MANKTDFQNEAQARKDALDRAAEQGLPDAERPSSGPFLKKNNLGDYLHPRKDTRDVMEDAGKPHANPLNKYLKPAQDDQPHEGTPKDREEIPDYISQ